MMRIAIDLNGVLRDTIGKFTQVYDKHMMNEVLEVDESSKIFSNSGDTEWELVNTNNENFDYGYSLPITSLNLQEFFKFKDDDEYYSFMYEEFPMQIFGHAGSTEMTSFNDLNDFYTSNRDTHRICLVSDEIGKSKPATLFFLSKFGCLIEEIRFFNETTKNLLWDEIDVLLTANPDLLLNKPDNKIVIKFETEYNKNVQLDLVISSIKNLDDKLKQII
jgi:hypothetical protein